MHKTRLTCPLAYLILLAAVSTAGAAAPRFTGPWRVEELLSTPPEATWGQKQGLTQEVYYAGEPFGGKPTRVFAYYARPASGDGPFPAMLLIHGGGGKAFAEWATLWAERGYVALAMDTAGHGPDGARLPDGGPEQNDEAKFGPFDETNARDMWTYHAVAAALRGHALLASRPEVDPERIGVTGISWGGYLTCLVAGLDDRLKVAVPVYGCGFLGDNSVWLPTFDKMPAEGRQRWLDYFDPSRYLPGAVAPMLFVNGTNDFAYPLDSYQKSYSLPPGRVDLCVRVRLPHGHPQGWAPVEIGLYADSFLKGGPPLARLSRMQIDGQSVSATFQSDVKIVAAELNYTADGGPWQQRNWQTVPATLEVGKVSATLPAERPLVYYLSVTDERGALTSAPHVEVAE